LVRRAMIQKTTKELDEKMKRLIADMYQHTNMSMGSIAAALKVSRETVRKYKDYWIPQQRL